jgi:hypothetical protein
VRGVYNDAIATRRADFSRKHEQHTGGLSRVELLSALDAKHQELSAVLDRVELEGVDGYFVESFGRQFSVEEYCHVIVQHESLHHGEWSVYASLAGFETPLSWRLNWAL